MPNRIRSSPFEVNGNGKVSGVKMVRTEMGEPDAKGRRRAEIVAGSEHIVPADAVIMAFGFRPHNMEWLAKHSVELDSQRPHHRPRRQRQRLPDQQPENLCWRRYRPWFRSGRYRHCRRSQSGRRHYELAGSLSEVTINSPDSVWRIYKRAIQLNFKPLNQP